MTLQEWVLTPIDPYWNPHQCMDAPFVSTNFDANGWPTFTCKLCNCRRMNKRQFVKHCDNASHRDRVDKIKDAQKALLLRNARLDVVAEKLPHIRSLKAARWKSELLDLLFDYVFNSKGEEDVKFISEWDQHFYVTEAEDLYQHFQDDQQQSNKGDHGEPLEMRIERLGSDKWQSEVFEILNRYYEAHLGPDLFWSETAVGTFSQAEALLTKYEHMERVSLLELALWKFVCLSNPIDLQNDYLQFEHWRHSGWKAIKQDMRNDTGIAIVIGNVLPYLVGDKVQASTKV